MVPIWLSLRRPLPVKRQIFKKPPTIVKAEAKGVSSKYVESQFLIAYLTTWLGC